MKIDLANVAGVPGAHGRYEVRAKVDPIDGVTVVGPVTGEITVQNTGSLLVMRGRLHARIRMNCGRCLALVEQALEVPVVEEFASGTAGADVDTIDRESPAESAMEDFVFDVSEFARQQISLHVPMTILCREDCKGICPTCGQNLNEGPCECEPETEETPFSKLKDLLGDTPDRE